MAEQMQSIQRRIKSINSTERITNAMKLVSAAKLRKSKAAYESSKLYLGRLLTSIREILEDTPDVPARFLAGNREIKTKCLVVITSSNGLCGSFNANVLRTTSEILESYKDSEIEVKLATIGAKGRQHFAYRGTEILMEHDAPADTVTFEETKVISEPLMEKYLRGEIDEIDIVYTSYVNTLKQQVRVQPLLPLAVEKSAERASNSPQVDYEPSAEQVFDYLVPKYIELMIFSTCIESATCEYAARRTAMENANDNAKDMLSALQLAYNHARQAEITDEIIEIVAGSEASK